MTETVTGGPETMLRSGDARICAQAFGWPSDPAALLIMGQMASMLWWPDAFCERLAQAGRFVIRYDNRDTGRSTSYEPGRPPYSLDDLAGDAVAVLDGYGIARAGIVAMSLGGVIAQLVALAHPARVSSVTAISSTPIDVGDVELPGPDPDYLRHAAGFEDLDWSDRQALGELLVRDARHVSGSRHPFDEQAAHELVTRDLSRTAHPASLANHAMLSGGERWQGRLGEIAAPLLVIHGNADPLLPYAHGVALAGAVPAARLVTVDGGGHELHEDDWDQMLEAIVAQTASG
jgi:pimeloyl-ACP methyl ester carboxylesterase